MRGTHHDLLFGGVLAGPLHLVESYWPGVSLEHVAAADLETRRALGDLCRGDRTVEHVGSLLLGVDELLLRLFHGGSTELVRVANVRAGVPVERVVETVAITPQLKAPPTRRT